MIQGFFPNSSFAWAFVIALLGLLAPSSYIDWKRLTIPKTLSLTTLAVGLAFNAARGCWVGAQGGRAWALGPRGPFVGACDGLLFALAGFLVGFSIFFLMWLLRTCGGGDVKLFAAIGAWVGPTTAVTILAITVVFVSAIAIGKLIRAAVAAGFRGAGAAGPDDRRRLISFSLPVTLATALVVFWVFRDELSIAPDGRGSVAAPPARIGGQGDA